MAASVPSCLSNLWARVLFSARCRINESATEKEITKKKITSERRVTSVPESLNSGLEINSAIFFVKLPKSNGHLTVRFWDRPQQGLPEAYGYELTMIFMKHSTIKRCLPSPYCFQRRPLPKPSTLKNIPGCDRNSLTVPAYRFPSKEIVFLFYFM